ncbi:MAG: phosphoglycerate kinase [Phycisphaerales bacterium]|nr:MAG: phosphoglycerate kinase [Phycisphaerales bacterium]
MPPVTIDQIDVSGKRALIRVDFNVPMEGATITDDRRIRSALPTLASVLDRGGSAVLMSHLGRPKGNGYEEAFSLRPVADRLAQLLDRPVLFPSNDCIDQASAKAVQQLEPGRVLLLENLRFHAEEKAGDPAFARALAAYGDLYVNDAFGTCHREDASMVAVPLAMGGKPKVAGLLVAREVAFLSEAVANPRRPMVVILGGAKVSSKIGAIEHLMPKCDAMLIGGAMAYTFLRAQGLPTGKSLVEEDHLATARRALQAAESAKVELLLPIDHVVAERFDRSAPMRTVERIDDASVAVDIGPKTSELYARRIEQAACALWNGPMGVFEWPGADGGTRAVAQALARATRAGAVTIVGGGDSAAALDAMGLAADMTHVSTGGGASVEMLEGKRFRALEVLDQRPAQPADPA